jgi:hypothetical protein
MKKIPTLFKRDFSNKGQIIPEYNDGTDWVLRGEGVATRKFDGMAALVRDDKLYKRYEVRPGKFTPSNFEMVDFDETTGKAVGWVEVGWGSEDKYFREAIAGYSPDHVDLLDGTYELLGPKVQGNAEGVHVHILKLHADADTLEDVPVEFEALKAWLAGRDIEGVVWRHPDGRMVKIKKKDFKLKR